MPDVVVSEEAAPNEVPGSDGVVSTQEPVQKTLEELRREAEQRQARRRERERPARWIADMRELIGPDVAVVLGRQERPLGSKGDGDYYALIFRVEEQLAGPSLPQTIEVVQYAIFGEPDPEFGFRPRPGGRYALVIEPSTAVSGAWQIVMDFDRLLFGWGTEMTEGVFRVPAGPDTLSQSVLATLGSQ